MTEPADLRRLAEAATPGPWARAIDASRKWNLVLAGAGGPEEARLGKVADDDDAEFIAATDPTTVLGLIDELDALRARVAFAAAIVSGDATFDRFEELADLRERVKVAEAPADTEYRVVDAHGKRLWPKADVTASLEPCMYWLGDYGPEGARIEERPSPVAWKAHEG